jgi:hypothetical protein
VQETTASGASVFTSAIATCPAGTKLIGGAFAINGSVGDSVNGPRVIKSHKHNGETWFVQVVAPDGYSPARTYFVTAYAYCVNA